MNKKRGRPRAGTADGRQRILAAARDLFVRHGYPGTTLRAIAQQADCDVALIPYHFGSKKRLYAQAMALELAPSDVLARAIPGDPDTLGVRLLTHVTAAWEQPAVARSLTQLVHIALTDDDVRRPFLEYLDREIGEKLVEYFGGADARARATAVLTLVIGVIFGRYVLQVPTLATPDADHYLDALTPVARAATARRTRGAQRRGQA